MNLPLSERERKIDLSNKTPEEVDAITVQLGEKVRQICDEAVEKANRLLNVYGMSAMMQIVVDHSDKITQLKQQKQEQKEPKKKRGRPRKNANL